MKKRRLMTDGITPMPGISDFRVWDNRRLKGYSPGLYSACFRGSMDKLHIYELGGQVSKIAADRLAASVFDDRDNASAFPAFSSVWRGVQVTLFIPGK